VFVWDGVVPLCLDWCALEDSVEKYGCRPDSNDNYTDTKNPYVSLSDCYSHEKYRNAELDEHHICDVGDGR
jgi:hypothetical protein